MIMSKFIEGITILQRYFDKDGFNIGAEHDQFYVYSTHRPLSVDDIVKLRRLDWFQPEVDGDSDEATDEELVAQYDAEEGWSCFT